MTFLAPSYKVLAHNDTRNAKGHQAGPLIPKAIESYLPSLPATTSASKPTVSVQIDAELWVGTTHVGDVETRYQHQTWHGTRSPERRITGNLGQLLGHAKKDDLLVIERDDAIDTKYRLTLHKAGTAAHHSVVSTHPGKRWGLL